MSTDEALPPWARHHRPGFLKLLRALERVPGFILQPLETPARDLDRALAGWLTSQGRPAHIVAPSDEAGWRALAATLSNLPAVQKQVVIVSGVPTLASGVYHGLAMINLHRDGIARRLGCPLLWCGPPAFLHATWEQAPDFWSIGAIPKRFEPDSSMSWEPPFPPEGARAEDRESLQRLYDVARVQGDTENQARVGVRLLMAMLAEGYHEEAASLDTTLSDLGNEAMNAYDALDQLADLHTMGGSLENIQPVYEAILARAKDVGSLHLQAATLRQMGRLHRDAGRRAEARECLGHAMALFRALGDTQAEAASLLAFAQVVGGDATDIHLQRLEELVATSESPDLRSQTYFLLAQRLSAAERLEEALQMLAKSDGLAQVPAVVEAYIELSRGLIFGRMGDSVRARRHLTCALLGYEHLKLVEQAAQVHKVLAWVSFMEEDFDDAQIHIDTFLELSGRAAADPEIQASHAFWSARIAGQRGDHRRAAVMAWEGYQQMRLGAPSTPLFRSALVTIRISFMKENTQPAGLEAVDRLVIDQLCDAPDSVEQFSKIVEIPDPLPARRTPTEQEKDEGIVRAVIEGWKAQKSNVSALETEVS